MKGTFSMSTKNTETDWIDDFIQGLLVDYTAYVNGEPIKWNVKKAEAKQALRARIAAERLDERKAAETRWKREHDHWKDLAELLMKKDQFNTDPKMIVEVNPKSHTYFMPQPKTGDSKTKVVGEIDGRSLYESHLGDSADAAGME
jgi:hypothetical protein